jgi:hypothetical protein
MHTLNVININFFIIYKFPAVNQHNMARLWKPDLIEHQSNWFKHLNIIDSKNYGFLSLTITPDNRGLTPGALTC